VIHKENLHRYVIREVICADIKAKDIIQGNDSKSIFLKRVKVINSIKK